jgi:hypothetical protein
MLFSLGTNGEEVQCMLVNLEMESSMEKASGKVSNSRLYVTVTRETMPMTKSTDSVFSLGPVATSTRVSTKMMRETVSERWSGQTVVCTQAFGQRVYNMAKERWSFPTGQSRKACLKWTCLKDQCLKDRHRLQIRREELYCLNLFLKDPTILGMLHLRCKSMGLIHLQARNQYLEEVLKIGVGWIWMGIRMEGFLNNNKYRCLEIQTRAIIVAVTKVGTILTNIDY